MGYVKHQSGVGGVICHAVGLTEKLAAEIIKAVHTTRNHFFVLLNGIHVDEQLAHPLKAWISRVGYQLRILGVERTLVCGSRSTLFPNACKALGAHQEQNGDQFVPNHI
jgi:hypothetical protein